MIFEAFLFGIVGLGLEVMEIAIMDYPWAKDSKLMGYSSAWYFPFYAVVPLFLLHHFHGLLFSLPFYARGILYPVIFWIIEYSAMGLLRLLLGKSPSEDSYYQSRWNVHGLIRLDLAPVWIIFCFVFEWMFRNLRGI
ncbi:MAG: hypothetical protein HY549_09705 [Elusimicrobia bacterium]|nr:hypothetical protein [Elusimicrobiota bacterium]